MSDQQAAFTRIVKEAGIPTTEAELKQHWEAEVNAQGVAFSNNSDYSPWWRIVTALVTKPVLWLVQMLIQNVLPQMFVKTATGPMLDLLAWGVNLERKHAAKAQGILQFTRAEVSGTLEIPAGTAVLSANINGQIYSLVTLENQSFQDGEDSLRVNAEAVAEGQGYNLSSGYYAVMQTPIPGVAVTNPTDWLQRPGADRETDDELRERVRNQFSAVNQWHTDAVYTAIMASFDGVSVDNVYFLHGAPRGPGTANAYILLDTGTPDQGFLDQIQSRISDEGNHGHGDDLLVAAMPETFHDLTADLWLNEALTEAQRTQITADITQFIRAAFRENQDYAPTLTHPFSRFSFSRLGQELHREFPALVSIEFAGSDIVSELNVPRLKSLTVTAQ
ncbi:baseplate J/gp47 family protein [Hahella ganghwensis]|uniref:baseplate J/gp47 family protein n=1 Tax=Hahella ganghwensis TaxID=286420 RepID=UPI00036E5858|nr:baseplate J/gp47 family protein [Hahella ganghwensis]